jgi:hypothetical protein
VDNFIEADEPGACFQCGKPTTAVEINYEAYLHRECEAAADEKFAEAYNRTEA